MDAKKTTDGTTATTGNDDLALTLLLLLREYGAEQTLLDRLYSASRDTLQEIFKEVVSKVRQQRHDALQMAEQLKLFRRLFLNAQQHAEVHIAELTNKLAGADTQICKLKEENETVRRSIDALCCSLPSPKADAVCTEDNCSTTKLTDESDSTGHRVGTEHCNGRETRDDGHFAAAAVTATADPIGALLLFAAKAEKQSILLKESTEECNSLRLKHAEAVKECQRLENINKQQAEMNTESRSQLTAELTDLQMKLEQCEATVDAAKKEKLDWEHEWTQRYSRLNEQCEDMKISASGTEAQLRQEIAMSNLKMKKILEQNDKLRRITIFFRAKMVQLDEEIEDGEMPTN